MPRAIESAPRLGRPRSERTRRAILAAACELLLERGLARTSIEAVALEAGTSKATIYRWWPSKELLAADAVLSDWQQDEAQLDTGTLAGDLLVLLEPWVLQLTRRPYGRVIAALLACAQSDPAFAEEYRRRFVERRREDGREAFGRAIVRGEARADLDVELALDLLYGPVYHRLLNGHALLQEGFAREVVDHVILAVAANPSRDRPNPR